MSPSSDPYFRLDNIKGITVVTFLGPKLGIEVRDSLYSLVDQERHKSLLLNFENVPFFSSAPLGVLINLRKKVEEAGGQLKVCRLSPDLLELFRITKLDHFFAIHADQQDA